MIYISRDVIFNETEIGLKIEENNKDIELLEEKQDVETVEEEEQIIEQRKRQNKGKARQEYEVDYIMSERIVNGKKEY